MSTHQVKGSQEGPTRCPQSTDCTSTELSLKEVLDKYCSTENQDLLKHVLMAKAEEDKKQTAQELLKTEQARIYAKQLDIELIKEQSKINQSSTTFPYCPQVIQPQLYQYQPLFPQHHYHYSHAPVQQQVIAPVTSISTSPPADGAPVLTTANYTTTTDHPIHPYKYPIPEPSTATTTTAHADTYPSSAYSPDTNSRHRQQTINRTPTPPSSRQPTTPISPCTSTSDHEPSRKRYYTSIAAINNTPDTPTPTTATTTTSSEAKLSHGKVMEALKAKISQRGAAAAAAKKGSTNTNTTAPTPTSTATMTSNLTYATTATTNTTTNNPTATAATSSDSFYSHQHIDKRQRTLPKPYVSTSTTISTPPMPPFEVPQIITYPDYPPQHPHSTTSPRSIHKPILPPIDTSMRRLQPPTIPTSKDYIHVLEHHHHRRQEHQHPTHQQHPSPGCLSPIQTPRTNSSSSASSHSDSVSSATTTGHTATTVTAIAAAAIATMTVHPMDG